MHLTENVIHRVPDSAGDRAIDRRGGWLVCLGTGVGNDSAGRYSTLSQCPEKFIKPQCFLFFRLLYIRQRPSDALIGFIQRAIYIFALPAFESVFLIPYIQ